MPTLKYVFTRLELAGSLGDLGTLLPIAMAMILINGLNPVGLFVSVGLAYIFSGMYYGVTVPIQPMKVIGAYAIASSLSSAQIMASTLLMALLLTLIGTTRAIDVIARYIPKATVRGVQLSTGVLLMAGGVKFMLGTSTVQQLQGLAEPHLMIQRLGPVPIGIIIGTAAGLAILFLHSNKKLPAGLAVISAGFLLGLVLGSNTGLALIHPGIHLPQIMPFPVPGKIDFTFALLALVLPQLPMTMGNAVLAYTDLSSQYFGQKAKRITNRSACISMALANALSFLLGGMPLCHGAGGLAAHYSFGARTAGSNLFIGGAFILLAVVLGPGILSVLNLLPLAILGILLVFAGGQLALTVLDLDKRKDLFVAVLILGITLASNLAAGFLAGLVVAWCLKWERLQI